jgi:hypothetical protein
VLLPEQSLTCYLSTVIIYIALYESTEELRSDGMWCLETSAINVEIAIIPCMDGRRPKDHNTKIRTHSILEPWGHRNSPCSLVVQIKYRLQCVALMLPRNPSLIGRDFYGMLSISYVKPVTALVHEN